MAQTIAGFFMPLSVFFIAMLIAYALAKSKKKQAALSLKICAWLILYFSASPLTMNLLIHQSESGFRNMEIATGSTYDAIVVPGGITSEIANSDELMTQALPGIDRLFSGVRLYKEGFSDMLIISGGTSLPETETPEALRIYEMLEYYFDVNINGVYLEAQSVNTWQNAFLTKALMSEMHIGDRILLVTSARHMKRAQFSFQKAGFNVTPYATDFMTTSISLHNPVVLLPSAAALHYNSGVFREWLGRIYYYMKASV